MTTLFVRHKVSDYAAWRRVFDAFQPTAATLGVESGAVYQAADDPNDITVMHGFSSVERAHAFAGSTELRSAMHDAGVVGAPEVWFTQPA